METEIEKPMIMPEWKAGLEAMRSSGIHYGATFTAEFFEEHMRVPRDHMKFQLGLSEIRRELEGEGMYLNGRGGNGSIWVIGPANENVTVMRRYAHKAMDVLKRAVTLGINTPQEVLTDGERQIHAQVTERLAHKVLLMRRAGNIPKDLPQLKG